ncbi:MAG: SUMF1/EgtB/PvdO family nonheme iron enzyme [Gallionella sp.]|nr:SUMF1/EgtB/PvdO family nonheme iron enzyme [Gallionella sp.]
MKELRIILMALVFVSYQAGAADNRNLAVSRTSNVASEQRIALVIGNGAYKTAPLRNPPNDARLMARTLRDLGFEVIERIDADQKTMRRAIVEFAARLQQLGGDGVGLVFYAGHGVQSGGRNYLIPTGVQIGSEPELRIEAVSASELLEAMEGTRTRLNFIFLDACRDNPYTRSFRSAASGLARIDAPRGTLISYATRPGDVAADGSGENSPYSKALATAMKTPGLPVTELFIRVRNEVIEATGDKQMPWEEGGLTSQFYFSGRVEEVRAPVDTAASRQRVEEEEAARRAQEAARLELEKQRRYEALLSEGDASLAASDKKTALAKYDAALLLVPGSPDLAARIEQARMLAGAGDTFSDPLKDGSAGPEMVILPAGSYQMGDVEGTADAYAEASLPVHEVTFKKPFAIGKYEITFDDFDKFTRATKRPTLSDHGWGRGRRPATKIVWSDAMAYVRWLTEQTGKRYRIPTEAEWEYAARAGTRTRYWWGNEPSHEYANYGDGMPGWFPSGVVSGRDQWMNTAPVGQFPANPYGLYDMQGNVWEWVSDCWHENYSGAPNDGTAFGDNDCANRVMRGGSWGYNPDFMRAQTRIKVFWGVLSFLYYGVRVVRDVD